MFIVDLIAKKRQGQKLKREEINFIIQTYNQGHTPDYQISALLMAIMFQGLDDQETVWFTQAIINSGTTVDLSSILGPKVDKHSTGGVGDKVTLIIGPILAALNVNFAKMSGPGLGYTGGTVDKLASIPGYKVNLTIEEFIAQVNAIKIAVIAQTENLVPADKKLYALRDVTDTVASIPLITMSIMSKKIALGADKLLLDVKCGSGAFMKNLSQAEQLAQKMINIGNHFNKDVKVEITNMDEPLGQAIGNRIEVLEAIEILQNKGDQSLRDLVIASCTTMLMQVNAHLSVEQAQNQIVKVIKNGEAFTKFKQWIKTQHGDVKHLLSKQFWQPKFKHHIFATHNGYLNITNAINFGLCVVKLGGGREFKDQTIDYDAGIYLSKKTGDAVLKDQLLFTLYSSNPINEQHLELISQGFEISQQKKALVIIFKKMG